MKEDFIQNIQFDLFSVELVIGETATLLMAENYVTIREVFVDAVKVEPNENKQIFLPSALWEVGDGDIITPKDDRTFTIKKASEINAITGSADKYLNEQGDFVDVPIGVSSHPNLTDKNQETEFQHIDTTTTKETLVKADKVPIYDSVTGKVVLTDKNNVNSYSTETVPAPANAGTLTLKNATETVISTTLTNSNTFTIALPATTGKVNESILIFKVGSTLPSLTQPTGVIYRTETPTIAINQTWTFCYERVTYDSGSTYEIYVSATKNV